MFDMIVLLYLPGSGAAAAAPPAAGLLGDLPLLVVVFLAAAPLAGVAVFLGGILDMCLGFLASLSIVVFLFAAHYSTVPTSMLGHRNV